MNSKQKIKLATPQLSPGLQHEVDKLQRVFVDTQKYMEKLQMSGKSENLSNEACKLGNDLLMQKGHNVEIHRNILKRYSQSIAFAPQGSEELVLGYGNRSALLMHLQHYEEALIDIDRALQLSKADDYKKKMQIRRDKCVELLNEQNLIKSTKSMTLKESKELEKIRSKVENFKPSARVASAADCVDIAHNDQVGRHLVATRDIKPGEIVIVEKGYVCSPRLSEMNMVCFHCAQYAWNGIPCDKCVYAIYCSEDCKKEAFKEYHDIECLILKYMHATIFNTKNGDRIFTTIRLFIKALKEEGFDNVMKEISREINEDTLEGLLSDGMLKSDFKACYNLSPWLKDIGAEYDQLEVDILRMLYFLINQKSFLALLEKNSSTGKTETNSPQAVIYKDGFTVVDPCVLLKFKKALMRLKFIVATNSYAIRTGSTQCCRDLTSHMKLCQLVKGTAIVPCCIMVNHSCTPNVTFLSTSKRKFVYFSTCPIKKGEMLCSGYRSVSIAQGDVKTRQMRLKDFVCKCRACLENISMSSCLQSYMQDINNLRTELKRKFPSSFVDSFIMKSEDFETSEKVFQDIIKISQFVYKRNNYYKAYIHNGTCFRYFEILMAKLYPDKIYMPNNC